MNENENKTTPNLWDSIKAVLRGRFIAIQAYLKKQEKSQINNLTLHLKLKLNLQYSGHLTGRVESLEKTLMLGGIWSRRRRG